MFKVITFFIKRIQRFFLLKSLDSIFKMNLFCKIFGYKVVFSKTLKGFLVRDISKQGLKINIGSMSRSPMYLEGGGIWQVKSVSCRVYGCLNVYKKW